MTTATAPVGAGRKTASRIYWLHALSPLHVGSGRGVGFVDLPIMREKVTQWPFVPGSAVKGVYADECDAAPEQRKNCSDRAAAFGIQDDDSKEGADNRNNAGSLVFTDARLVALPVRSLYGTFAWCTSSFALQRLKRDLETVGATGVPEKVPADVPAASDGSLQVRVTPESVLKESGNQTVFLEDLDLRGAPVDPDTAAWARHIAESAFSPEWRTEFQKRFAIVPNDVFDFLCERATEIQAHVRLNDESKTVATGALWYEESLPTESLLVGFVACDRVYRKPNGMPVKTEAELLQQFCPAGTERSFQLGGKASVGKGRVRCRFQA